MTEPAEERSNGPRPIAEAEEAEEQVEREEEEAPSEPGIEEQLAQERERSTGYLEELQRERASFINYRRRAEQEKQQWVREANAALIFNILPVLDDFERARQSVPEDQQDTPWVDGVVLVGRKLYSTLELAGLRQIEAEGRPFDPSIHEAVSTVPADEHEPGTVVQELRRGYKLGERVLRPSMVVVAQEG